MPLPAFLKSLPDGTLLAAKVQPRASRDAIGEPLGDELRLRVTAPPVDAAANEAVIRLLAKRLRLSRGRIQLVRGQTSRHKAFRIQGLPPEDVLKALTAG